MIKPTVKHVLKLDVSIMLFVDNMCVFMSKICQVVFFLHFMRVINYSLAHTMKSRCTLF